MTTNETDRIAARYTRPGDQPTQYEDGTTVDYSAKLKPAPSGGEEGK